MTAIFNPAAYLWGRIMGGYTLRAASVTRITVVGDELIPAGPAIYIGWHGANLIELTLMNALDNRSRLSFVPTGVVGAAMRGLLAGVMGVEPVRLPGDEAGGVRTALRTMSHALHLGYDVVVACDGPGGPARQVKRGAVWLAKMTGYPLVPVGCAARPALSIPRWDRLLVPLPGARSVSVFDHPIWIGRKQRVDTRLLTAIEDRLNAATDQAWEIASQSKIAHAGPRVDLVED